MKELGLKFRVSTDIDVEKIHYWLIDQEQRQVHGSFFCNWGMTKEKHSEKELIVATLNCEPIAYIWEDFGILEVQEAYRKQGVGKRLVEFAINRAISRDKHAISIECAPETSIPFWKKMGFEFYNDKKASIVFKKKLSMPSIGEPVKIEIGFYPEAAEWDSKISAVKFFSLSAMRNNEGVIHLEYRVSAFISRAQYCGDAVVKICLDGKKIYFGKAKYPKAQKLGVISNSGAFSLEKVLLSTDM